MNPNMLGNLTIDCNSTFIQVTDDRVSSCADHILLNTHIITRGGK